MIILTPLTLKGTRSMMMMQQLQPEMKKIQTQYKDDRQKLNEEMMKFYKENNINPVGGCLPLLVQMPVFLVLYHVLRGLTQRVPASTRAGSSGQFGTGVPTRVAAARPRSSRPTCTTTRSSTRPCSQTTVMDFAGMDLAGALEGLQPGHRATRSPTPADRPRGRHRLRPAAPDPGPQHRRPGQPAAADDHEDHAVLPAVISFTLPAGLVLYFVVSNLYRVGQQGFISRSIYGTSGARSPATGGNGTGKTGRAPRVPRAGRPAPR